MFFVRKKKYDEMEQSRERWKKLADRWMSHTEEAYQLAEKWQNVAVACQEDNKRIIAHEEKLLARVKELEAKLDFIIKQRDYDCDLLGNTSDAYEEGRAISREAE